MEGGVKGGGEVIFSALNLYPNSVRNITDAKRNKEFLDLLSIYAQLEIEESVLSHFQTGRILLNDSNDIPSDFPVAGGNILHLTYNVQEGPKETEIDCWFRVVAIKNIIINERKQAFTLQLISEDGWNNMHTVLTSAFEGEPSDIIRKICGRHLIKSDKKIFADASVGGLKFVCPMWKPSQAITWVTHKALSASTDTPGFFFYETMKGFRFLSTDTMLDYKKNVVITDVMAEVSAERDKGEQVKKGYLYKIPGIPVHGADGKPKSGMVGSETMQNVDDFRVLERQTYAKDAINGNIATKHITHDIFHKSYDVQRFDYWKDFNKVKRIGAERHYEYPDRDLDSNMSVNLTGMQSRMHSNRKDSPGSRTLYANDYGLMRKQVLKQINDEVISNFEAPGATLIESGRILEFNYPAIRKVNDPEDVYQKKFSGYYLIRDVIHIFKPVANTTSSYKVDMNIVKDGWNA